MSAPTVSDIDTDNTILLARLLSFSEESPYGSYARQAVDHLGLAALIPRVRATFSINLSDFFAALPRTVALPTSNGEPSLYRAAREIRHILDTHLDNTVTAIHLADTALSLVPCDSPTIDRDTVIAQWGDYTTPYPPAGTAEVDNHRRELINTLRTYGTEQDWGQQLEYTIESIGLIDYITEPVTIDLTDLDVLTVRVPVRRDGSRRDDQLAYELTAALTAELGHRPGLIVSPRITDSAPVTTR